jgi:hypothetical protein
MWRLRIHPNGVGRRPGSAIAANFTASTTSTPAGAASASRPAIV